MYLAVVVYHVSEKQRENRGWCLMKMGIRKICWNGIEESSLLANDL